MRLMAAWIILLFCSSVVGCSDGSPADIPLAPEFATPVATGIYVTTAASPELIGVWGKPADHVPSSYSSGSLPTAYAISPLYPNPSDGATVLSFALPVASEVAVWIVPARGPGEGGSDFTVVSEALLPSPQRAPIAYPLLFSRRPAGRHLLVWDGRSGGGEPVPSGFYRIYVRFGENIYWRDVFVYRDIADIPADLRSTP